VRHPLLDNTFAAFGPPLVSLLLVCRQQLRLLLVWAASSTAAWL
jgi:hypothetical protein